MKHENVRGHTNRQLKELDVFNDTAHLSGEDLFCGSATDKLAKKMDRRQRRDFHHKIKQAYTQAAVYIQEVSFEQFAAHVPHGP